MKTTKYLGILSFLLVFSSTLFSQDNMPDWSINPALFENSGSITASVSLDGVTTGSEDDILAAFVGDEVRGLVNGIYFPPSDVYLFYLSVFSNEMSGELLTFKFYNFSSDTVFDLAETIEFNSNMFLGGPLSPYIFTNLTIDCAGVPGGNSYLDDCGVCDDDPINDNITCSGCMDEAALNYDPEALFDDGSCVYPQGTDWVIIPSDFENNGSIVAKVLVDGIVNGSVDDQVAAFMDGQIRGVANGIYFSVNDVYLFPVTVYSNQSSGETLTFQYYRASDDQIFDIVETMGFTSNMLIGTPLNPVNFHAGIGGNVDCLGVEGGTAYYDQCGVCDDNLDNDDATCSGCTDPGASNYDPGAIVNDGSCQYPGTNDVWQINPSEFEFNGAVIARVYLDGLDSGSSGDQLAGFVNGEIRGVTDGIFYPPGGYYVFMLTAYSNMVSGETISFQFYDSETDLIYAISETVEFSSDMLVGSLNSPLLIHGDLYGPDWYINPYNFENSGNIIATIYVDGFMHTTETSDKITAFVDGEIRGVTNGLYFPPGDYTVFMLTIYSNISDGEMVNFQYWDASTDEIFDIDEQIEFISNMLLGSPTVPYQLNITTLDCNGDPGGTAFIDDCDVCSEGNTGHPENSDMDCTGECFGTFVEDDFDGCCEALTTFYADNDSDNFGDMGNTIEACIVQDGYVENADDCNDESIDINPDAVDDNCDGVDDDCNTINDDGYVPTSTECGIGVCAATGMLECIEGLEVDSCVEGSATGADDDCNGIDEDCSGTADDNYLSTETACGVGVCESTGMLECIDGSEVDSCVAGDPTGADDDCNGVDEDCSGTADDNYLATETACGVGVCAAIGMLECIGGEEVDSCVEGDPSDEDCNGLDDNCDGEIPLDETMDNDLDGIVNCEDLYPDCYFDFYDCNGECGGTAIADECGVCEGDGSSCNQPFANNMDISLNENDSVAFTLDAGDPNDLPLEIIIETPTAFGSLECTNETLSCVYTPELNYSGTDGFQYHVFNGTWSSESAVVTITIANVNNIPIALSQDIQILEDQPVIITLSGTDEDTPEEYLQFQIVQQPQHGVLSENRVLAEYLYTPVANYYGTDSFTFNIFDGIGNNNSNTAIVNITILPENDPPTIVSVTSNTGSFEIYENTTLQISVTLNDIENDELALQVTGDSPFNGNVSFVNATTFVYTPAEGFVGIDQIIIEAVETLTDPQLSSGSTEIQITVLNINDPPEAFSRNVFLNEDETRTFRVMGEDPEEQPITFSIVNPPLHGSATLNGQWVTYIPVLNYNGSDVMTFRAFDGALYSPPATVSITIYPRNDRPTAQDFSFTFSSDPDTISFSGHVFDVDGDNLTMQFIPQSQGIGYSAFGAMVTHISGLNYSITPGSMSPDYLVYKAKDAVSESNIRVITLENPGGRENIYRDVPIAYNQDVSLSEDSTTDFSLLGLDVAHPWPTTGATYQITQAPLNGTITENLVYTVLPNQIMAQWILEYTPFANFDGTDSLKYTVTNPNNPDGDPAGVSNEATITFNITGENDQPLITEITDKTTPEDTPLVVPISYIDPDNTLNLTTTSTRPLKLTITPQNIVGPDENGMYTGSLLLTTVLNYSGTITVTLTVTEGEGSDFQQDTEIFVLTVTPVNDPPVVVPITNCSTNEETPLTITLSASDVDTPIGNVTYAAVVTDNPTMVTVSIVGSALTMTPTLNYAGITTISVTANDHQPVNPISIPVTFTLTVNNINDPPYFTNIIAPSPISEDGGAVLVQFTVMDPDAGDLLSVSTITNNSELFPTENIIISPGSQSSSGTAYLIALTPAQDLFGSAVVIFNLTDDDVTVSTQVEAVVNEVNDTPVLSTVGDQTIDEDGSITLTLSATDVDTDVALLVFSASTGENVNADVSGNQLTLTPAPDHFGEESVEIYVSDGNSSDSETITLVITAMDDAPVITSTAPTSAIINSEYTYQVTVSDADPEDVTFTYSLANEPEGMLVSATGLVTWTPAFGIETSGFVTLTVSDPDLLTDTEEYEITVDQIDCNGDVGGTAVIDDCGVCSDGNTGHGFNSDMDCNGVCLGTAFFDDCDDCVGGDTGFTACGPYTMDLHVGSNLRSFPALPESPILSDVFQPNDCDYNGIITASQASQYFCGSGLWQGNLTEINLLNSYWIKMNNPVTLEIAGLMPEAYPTYNLDAGSNFVSYPFFEQGSFFDVLPGDVLANSTGIIGEGVAAFYYNDQWVGSLTTGGFVPTMGYIFQMNAGISFSYNEPGMSRSSEVSTIPSLSDVPSEFQYNQSSMQAFYFIENITNEGLPISTDDWIVAYHNGVVVGARQWLGTISDIPVMGYDGTENTMDYLTDGWVPEFKLYDASHHKIIDVDVDAPVWQNLGLFVLGELSTHVELPTQVSLLPAYPNPFNPRTTIRYQLSEQTNVSLVVVNMIGQEVTSLVNTQQQPGEYAISWDASDLASGIYFIKLVTENQTSLQKLMLIK